MYTIRTEDRLIHIISFEHDAESTDTYYQLEAALRLTLRL